MTRRSFLVNRFAAVTLFHAPLDILKGHQLVSPRRDIRLEKRDEVLGTYWELFPLDC